MQKYISIYLLQKFKTPNYIINDLKTRGIKFIKYLYSKNYFWMRIHINNYLNLIPKDITRFFTDKYPGKLIELFNLFTQTDEFKSMKYLKNKVVSQKIIDLIPKIFPNSHIFRDSYKNLFISDDNIESYQIYIQISIRSSPNLCFTVKKYMPENSKISSYIEIFTLIYNQFNFNKLKYNHSVIIRFHGYICKEKYLDELRK